MLLRKKSIVFFVFLLYNTKDRKGFFPLCRVGERRSGMTRASICHSVEQSDRRNLRRKGKRILTLRYLRCALRAAVTGWRTPFVGFFGKPQNDKKGGAERQGRHEKDSRGAAMPCLRMTRKIGSRASERQERQDGTTGTARQNDRVSPCHSEGALVWIVLLSFRECGATEGIF